jgi:hypothetical protein
MTDNQGVELAFVPVGLRQRVRLCKPKGLLCGGRHDPPARIKNGKHN